MPSGAPKGNNNAGKNKPWRDALNIALARYQKGDVKKGMALRRIAEKVVEEALGGNLTAYQEIANRLDGKPHQSVGLEVTPAADYTRQELEAQLIALGVDPAQVRDGRCIN